MRTPLVKNLFCLLKRMVSLILFSTKIMTLVVIKHFEIVLYSRESLQCCVGIVVCIYQLDSNKTYVEKAKSELQKNDIGCFEQILKPIAVLYHICN